MIDKKPTLLEKTKDIATTYTGTFIVVMILNQLLFFGFCLNPICIIAAMPHVLLITVAVGTAINKMGKWGERQVAKKTTKSISRGIDEFGNAFNSALDKVNKAAEIELEKANQRTKELRELRELKKSLKNTLEQPTKPLPPKFNLDKYRPPETSKVKTLGKSNNTSITTEHCHKSELATAVPQGHQKVFITRNNLINIVRKANTSRFSTKDFEALYHKDLSQILSHKEMALLCVYKEVCQNPNSIYDSYKEIEASNIKHKYAFEGGTKSYHRNQDCELLHGDYFNIEIPPEIKNKGENEVMIFKEFCVTKRALIDKNEVQFLNKLQAEFMLVNPPKTIKATNSGVENFENIDLKLLMQQIDTLLVDAESYRGATERNTDIIDRLGYGSHRVKETADPNSPLHSWHFNYKLPLKDLMRHYFRIRFNENLAFDDFLLEKLGLKLCKKCGG